MTQTTAISMFLGYRLVILLGKAGYQRQIVKDFFIKAQKSSATKN